MKDAYRFRNTCSRAQYQRLPFDKGQVASALRTPVDVRMHNNNPAASWDLLPSNLFVMVHVDIKAKIHASAVQNLHGSVTCQKAELPAGQPRKLGLASAQKQD